MSCSECGTTMAESSSIGTNGYYCPNPNCADANGARYQLK